ncbi:MAG: c-type cytochrome [Gammaproteobacteria bacterium]
MALVGGTRAQKGLVALAVLSLAACDTSAPPASETSLAAAVVPSSAPRATPFDPGPIRTAAEYLADPAFVSADPSRGQLLSYACAACHTFGVGGGTLIGPNLHAVFGRRAAAVAGFDYSPALLGSGLVWTPVSLEAWLNEPGSFVVGTKMAFTGYRSPDDRRDLIAYLLRATQ